MWPRDRRRMFLHVLFQILRSLQLFCLYNFVKHMKFELSFTIRDLGKPNLSVVHQIDYVVFMLVQKPTISTYFSAVDFDMCAHISAMRFVVRDANDANNCGSDDAGIVAALGLSLSDFCSCWRAPRNWKGKMSITSRAGKISIARTNFLPARFLKHRYVSTLISQKLQYSRTFLGLIARLD